MLLVDGVHKSFGSVRAVQGISFELKPGQVAGLLGPNGAGKTTTIRMITGFNLPDQGRVLIGGYDTIDRGAAPGGPYALVQAGLTVTSFTDTNVESGGTYYYVVRARTAAGESAPTNEIRAAIP